MNKKLRELLIQSLRRHLQETHIKMQVPMEYYLRCLESGRNLSPKYLRTIAPYLRRDMKATDRRVQSHFQKLIGSEASSDEAVPQTLDQFFPQETVCPRPY